ncbi:MAG TPA: Ig-like domain-containing protein, partial [Candidatus Limnocylindrales bacterium]|nr:Ig-like domain-containing protein [Candidatus Limnocylindrales bacterium]
MSVSEERPAGIDHGEAPLRRGRLATLAVLAVSFALVATTLVGLAPRESPSPSPSPTTTPVAGVTASPSPPPITGDWSALRDLPPIEPAATLTADRADGAGIAPDTTFTLASMTTVAGADLAAGLAIEPAVALRVLPGSDPATVTVAPAQPLEPGTRYRFRLTGPDGALAGAWAFQVKGPLHVVTTLPADRSSGVPLSTGIELTFDQDGVIDAASHLSIEPQVEGRFETHGRTLVFVPGKLEPATLYTVTLQAGVGVAGSDVRLEQDVRLRFETGTAPASTKEPDVRFGRAVIEASPAEKPVIVIAVYSPEEGTPGTRIPVEIYR